MRRKHRSPTALRLFRHARGDARDRELLEQLDALVERAVEGDGRAVGAIAIAFGPTLLAEAKSELGALHEQDAADVLQAFFRAMSEGGLRLPAIRGGALPWMKRSVRTFAQGVRREQAEGRAGGG